MSIQQEFDQWANSGRDRGMEERHWHTAKHALARMPIERGESILDLGTGSGYALRALRETQQTGKSIGLDGSPQMVQNAQEYTEDAHLSFVHGDFHHLPLKAGSVDHVWSMEAFYYSECPVKVLTEINRVLRSGGTFFCAVNFYEESEHTHNWQKKIDVDMQLMNKEEYRNIFDEGGLYVAEQDTIADTETKIPPAETFPTSEWESRAAMVDRYRTWGTLLTVGVAP